MGIIVGVFQSPAILFSLISMDRRSLRGDAADPVLVAGRLLLQLVVLHLQRRC
eukprot:COSAG01_NODE_5377_length_4298_cov_2.455347_10_plen_52_part_01